MLLTAVLMLLQQRSLIRHYNNKYQQTSKTIAYYNNNLKRTGITGGGFVLHSTAEAAGTQRDDNIIAANEHNNNNNMMNAVTPTVSIASSRLSNVCQHHFDDNTGRILLYMNMPPNEEATSNDIDNNNYDNNNEKNNQIDCIPSTVLQYEHQIRKHRAAKKTTAPLTVEKHLHVVHVDESILVANKPSGILCVPGIHQHSSSLLNLVHQLYPPTITKSELTTATTTTTTNNNNNNSPSIDTNDWTVDETNQDQPFDMNKMIIHRLDMDTSGLVVFGRTRHAVSFLHKAFRGKQLQQQQQQKQRRKNSKKKNKYLYQKQQEQHQGNGDNNGDETSEQNKHHDEPSCDIEKQYEALVCGHLDPSIREGLIDLPLSRDHEYPPFMRVATPQSEQNAQQAVHDLQHHGWKKLVKRKPKPSQSEFIVLSREYLSSPITSLSASTCNDNDPKEKECNNNIEGQPKESSSCHSGVVPVTRIALFPKTGRTHQLRVHCAAMGHPIVGDPAYGLYGEAAPRAGLDAATTGTTTGTTLATTKMTSTLEAMKELANYPTMCLHAKILSIPHPETNKKVTWEVPAPF